MKTKYPLFKYSNSNTIKLWKTINSTVQIAAQIICHHNSFEHLYLPGIIDKTNKFLVKLEFFIIKSLIASSIIIPHESVEKTKYSIFNACILPFFQIFSIFLFIIAVSQQGE